MEIIVYVFIHVHVCFIFWSMSVCLSFLSFIIILKIIILSHHFMFF